jgi:hypothetical protein
VTVKPLRTTCRHGLPCNAHPCFLTDIIASAHASKMSRAPIRIACQDFISLSAIFISLSRPSNILLSTVPPRLEPGLAESCGPRTRGACDPIWSNWNLGSCSGDAVELTQDRTVMRKIASDRRAEVKVDLTMGERTIDPIDEGFDVAGSRRRPIPVLIVRSLATWRHVLRCSPAYFEKLGPFAAIVRTRRP